MAKKHSIEEIQRAEHDMKRLYEDAVKNRDEAIKYTGLSALLMLIASFLFNYMGYPVLSNICIGGAVVFYVGIRVTLWILMRKLNALVSAVNEEFQKEK